MIRITCFFSVINYAHAPDLGALPRRWGKAHMGWALCPIWNCMYMLSISYSVIIVLPHCFGCAVGFVHPN